MIVVVGMSHKTAPLEVREKLVLGDDVVPRVLAKLSTRKELAEAMFLSTCNRVEVFAAPKDEQAMDQAVRAAREVLAAEAGSGARLESHLYELSGRDALLHLFRVAASLDSMVLGEPQILGQVKSAFDAAEAAGTVGQVLRRCVPRAFTAAKRVRTETQLGAGTVSVSSVAVDLARRIFGDLSGHSVLLVGAGEMAEAAAKGLGKGARHVRVCNRSFDRGAALAGAIGGDAVQWDALGDELVLADVIVASTSSRSHVITHAAVKRAMKERKGRSLFFVDIAVPRNVEPTVHKIDNVYVYNVDDLEGEVARGRSARKEEAERAEAILLRELAELEAWSRGLLAAPAIVALRAKTRATLAAELERTLAGRLKHLPEGDRAALVQMVESATNKLLHVPTTRLRERVSADGAVDLVEAVAHLFDLRAVDGRSSMQDEQDEQDEDGKGTEGGGQDGEPLPH